MALGLLLALSACKKPETYPSMGLNLASPVDVVAADDGQHFYVLNADFDETYNRGSLLVMDRNGNKVMAVEVPRMGRSLTLAGSDLLVTADYQDDTGKRPPRALLFDVSDPVNPVLKADFSLECGPVNAVMRKGYPYFAVTCTDGSLLIGTLPADRSQATIKRVRQWGMARRALHLDPKRQLIFAFPTYLGAQDIGDEERLDVTSYDSHAVEIKSTDGQQHANDVPDDWEQNQKVIIDRKRQVYQYVVYDIAAEKANAPGCTPSPTESCSFPFRSNDTDPVAMSEVRWIHFKLANFDGTPDQSPHFNDSQYKFYRTNFYAARPDPDSSDVFYLSHRGSPDKSRYANQIVKVTIKGDLHATSSKNADGSTSYTTPLTGDVLSFERAYGFKGDETTKFAYTGDFAVGRVNGRKIVLVNNFRDLSTWTRADRYFSLGAQTLVDSSQSTGSDGSWWFSELIGDQSAKNLESFYQVALSPSGRALSCSFYGNALILLDVTPGVDITRVNRIE